MTRLWMTAVIATLGCGTAFAQVGGMGVPTPGIAATSPLGMSGGSQPGTLVGPTGIPLGATELNSTGMSPMFTDPTGMMASGTACSAGGSASSGIAGGISGISTYDGGGVAAGGGIGAGAGSPGSTASCTAASAGTAPATASAPSASPRGASRTGIPLGSVEIGNAGVSPLITVPTPMNSSSPIGTFGPSPSILGTPTLPATPVPPSSPTPGTGFAPNQSIMPCGSIVTSGPATFC
jgi:hypothetical protein